MSDADERPEFPDPPTEQDIEARLADSKRRIEEARSRPAAKSSMDLDPETSKGMGVGLAAAYAIIGMPLVGVLLGWLADNYFKTQIFTLVGVLLGGVGGVLHAVRLTNRDN